MAVKPIARSYWRLIKAGSRIFASVPDGVKDDVKTLAKEDVVHGVISPDQYKNLIVEEYVMWHKNELEG